MKVEIVYTSLSGCTEKLAKAIFDGIPANEKAIYNIKDGDPPLTGDIILVGYWGVGSGPCDEFKEFLHKIKGKAVGVFCTLGYYADTTYAKSTIDTAISILKENNDIIGSYICNGAISPVLKLGQGTIGEDSTPTQQKEIRWEITDCHPTAAECALGAERFKERVYLYARCKELNIPFTSVI